MNGVKRTIRLLTINGGALVFKDLSGLGQKDLVIAINDYQYISVPALQHSHHQ